MFSIPVAQFYCNLNIVGAITYLPQPQPLFSNKWGVSFEFKFCQNKDDKLNDSMPCITHIVVLHAYLKRSQILLTFSRH